MSVLEAHNLTKSFTEGKHTVQVLNDVSLGLDRGEVVALEGPSGSGKTTLLSILGCILTPSSGTLSIDGTSVPLDDSRALTATRRRSLGFVFQQFNLFPALSALENVEYALNTRGHNGRRARREAQDMIEAVGLAERMHALPRDLSGGQKQRVAIARALVGGVPLVLADEPTANLDLHTGNQVLDLFSALVREQRRALLIVTHDPKVRRIADRVLRIEDGVLLN